MQTNAARVAKIVDLGPGCATDLANNTVPNYVWISPDQCHDMHGRGATPADPCDFSQIQPLIATGDSFLLNTVNAIMTSKSWTGNSVIFITWDESDFTGTGPEGFGDTSGCCDANPGGGHVVTLVISNALRFARSSDDAFNHYSMLATIEDSWNLGCPCCQHLRPAQRPTDEGPDRSRTRPVNGELRCREIGLLSAFSHLISTRRPDR